MIPKPIIGRLVFLVILGAFSCTIIQDSDVATPTALAALRLSSVKMTQTTAKGNSLQEFKMLYDSVQNFIDPATNTKITRKVEYSLPAISSTSKLKFRSGSTKATSFHIYYAGSNPYSLGVHEKDSVIELYRFRYSGSGQLNKIITILNPIDNQDIIWISRDSLVYNQTRIMTLIRTADGAATYSMNYNTQGNVYYLSGVSSGAGSSQLYNSGAGNCPNSEEGVNCATYQCNTCGGGGNLPEVRIMSVQTNRTTFRVSLDDLRNQTSGNNRDGDTYYFHPTMILRGQLQGGEYLLPIYMIDWWLRGPTNPAGGILKDEDVSFDFNYVK
jgi:hypothetical protein